MKFRLLLISDCFILGHGTHSTPFSKHYIRERGIFLEISKNTLIFLEAVSGSAVRGSFFTAGLTESLMELTDFPEGLVQKHALFTVVE